MRLNAATKLYYNFCFSLAPVLKHRAFHVRHSHLPLSREEEEARVINCGTSFRNRFEALRRCFNLVWLIQVLLFSNPSEMVIPLLLRIRSAHLGMVWDSRFSQGRCLLEKKKIFCVVYDYARKVDLSKGFFFGRVFRSFLAIGELPLLCAHLSNS